jgi:hypothetical protein
MVARPVAPVTTPVQSPLLTPPSTPASKPVIVSAALSRRAQITALQEQLQFSEVELSAQVDLLAVINDTNLFGQNMQVVALGTQLSTPAGGSGTN